MKIFLDWSYFIIYSYIYIFFNNRQNKKHNTLIKKTDLININYSKYGILIMIISMHAFTFPTQYLFVDVCDNVDITYINFFF